MSELTPNEIKRVGWFFALYTVFIFLFGFLLGFIVGEYWS